MVPYHDGNHQRREDGHGSSGLHQHAHLAGVARRVDIGGSKRRPGHQPADVFLPGDAGDRKLITRLMTISMTIACCPGLQPLGDHEPRAEQAENGAGCPQGAWVGAAR